MHGSWGTAFESTWLLPRRMRRMPIAALTVRPVESSEGRDALDVLASGAERGDILAPQALFLEGQAPAHTRTDGAAMLAMLPRPRAHAVATLASADAATFSSLAPEAVADQLVTVPRTPKPRARLANRFDVPRVALTARPLLPDTVPPGGGAGPYYYAPFKALSGTLSGALSGALGTAEDGPQLFRLREPISVEPRTVYTSQSSQQPLRTATTVSLVRPGRPYAQGLGALEAIHDHGVRQATSTAWSSALPARARGLGSTAASTETLELFLGQQLDIPAVRNYVVTGTAARAVKSGSTLRLIGNTVGSMSLRLKLADGTSKTVTVRVRKPGPTEYVQSAIATFDSVVRAATNQRLVVDDWQDAALLRVAAPGIREIINQLLAALAGAAQVATTDRTKTVEVLQKLRFIIEQLLARASDETLRQTVLALERSPAGVDALNRVCNDYQIAARNIAAIRDIGNAIAVADALARGAQTFVSSSQQASSVVRGVQSVTGSIAAVFPRYERDPAKLVRDLGQAICEARRNPNALPVRVAVEKLLREKVVAIAPRVAAAATLDDKLRVIEGAMRLEELSLLDPNNGSMLLRTLVPTFPNAWRTIEQVFMGDPSPQWQVDSVPSTASLMLLTKDSTDGRGGSSGGGGGEGSGKSGVSPTLLVGGAVAVGLVALLVLRR